jgi:hypothetical protein
MNEQVGKASFFAFISHRGVDSKYALKLQKFIESYKLPAEIRAKSNLPKRLSPICTYEVDFAANPLLDEIKEMLAKSQYLIVLCSKHTAENAAPYVNYEIETFIEQKKAQGIDPLDKIIPIMISGEYDSPDGCYPQALKDLGDNAPIAVNRQLCKNDREVFLRAISGMIHIDYAVLENRDKKRQRKKKAMVGAICAALAACAIVLGEYFIPRSYHYLDFVMKNGLPVGIEKLSAAERSNINHYVITHCQHKVTELKHVNPKGNVIDHASNTPHPERPAIYTFDYSTGSKLASVTYRNKNRVPYFILQYSGNELLAADFKDPTNPGEAYFIGNGYESDAAKLLSDYNVASHSSISRFVYTYTPEGYVQKVTFFADSAGRMAHDNNIYGFEYELDEKGRITKQYFLDATNNRRLNSEGIFCKEYVYDEKGDLCKTAFYDANGNLAKASDGLCVTEREYENHICTVVSTLDENGNPAEPYGYAKQVRTGDTYKFYLSDGSLMSAPGFCGYVFTYDKNGYESSRTSIDADGKAVLDPYKEYATIEYENDKNGNVLSFSFLDEKGELTNNADGYAKEIIEYNGRGQATKNSYFDKDGKLCDYRGYGYSIKKTEYDEFGRETSISYFDADENPVDIKGPDFEHGYHRVETVYEHGMFTKLSIAYYDKDNNLTNSVSDYTGESYASSEMTVQNGVITSLKTFDKDGKLFGAHITNDVIYTAEAERKETINYLDADGAVTQKFVNLYDVRGVQKKYEAFSYHGKVHLKTHHEISYDDVKTHYVINYDERGKKVSASDLIYAADGTLETESKYRYDENEKEVYSILIDHTEKEPIKYFEIETEYRNDGTKNLERTITKDKDELVLSVSTQFFDEEGLVVRIEADKYNGNTLTRSTIAHFDENENMSQYYVFDYDADGNVKLESHSLFDETEQETYNKMTSYKNGVTEATLETYYLPDGAKQDEFVLYAPDGSVISKSKNTYDADGNIVEE